MEKENNVKTTLIITIKIKDKDGKEGIAEFTLNYPLAISGFIKLDEFGPIIRHLEDEALDDLINEEELDEGDE